MGILGGTFDPPQAGHVALAQAARAELPIDRLLVLVAESPGHREVVADEGTAFPTWKEPDEVLRWVRLAVGTRSGYPPPDLERYGDRVLSFELSSPPVSSTEVRDRLARGEPVDGLVPPAVAAALDETGLYRGYTDRAPERT